MKKAAHVAVRGEITEQQQQTFAISSPPTADIQAEELNGVAARSSLAGDLQNSSAVLASSPAVSNLKFHDLTGRQFGRLTVLRCAGSSPYGGAVWRCQCFCGQRCAVRGGSLRRGTTKSCGCLRRERTAERGRKGQAAFTHGHTAEGKCSREYISWRSMIERCTYPKHKSFKDYGGRGITICERWLHSFENFLADMGLRPQGMTLDRYPNNDGNYEPSNCRWATANEQRANRHRPTIGGEG